MLKFKVKNVIKEEQLVVIVVEPIKQSLLLEEAIPPGCIQHIISNIRENKKSKDICVKMCNILWNINMDDKTFRIPFLLIKFAFFHNSSLFSHPADNRELFRDYGGIELLRDSFEVHKDLSIAKAFSHAIDIDNSILITHIYLFQAHYF